MNHGKALVMKFLMVSLVLFLVGVVAYDMRALYVICIGTALTLLAYVIGDLFIFKRSGEKNEVSKRNSIATISDFLLAFVSIWLIGEFLLDASSNMVSIALVSAVLIAIGEWFFHLYLENKVFDKDDTRRASSV